MEVRPLDLAARRHSLAYLDHLGRVARGCAEAALEPLGLRPRHLIVLTLLTEQSAMTQQALGELLQLDASNVVGLLNELETRELVERVRSTEDRRRHIVSVTDKGRTALEEADRQLVTVESELLAALTAAERTTLRGLLTKVTLDRTAKLSE